MWGSNQSSCCWWLWWLWWLVLLFLLLLFLFFLLLLLFLLFLLLLFFFLLLLFLFLFLLLVLFALLVVGLLLTLAVADLLGLLEGCLGKVVALLSTLESAVDITLGVDSGHLAFLGEVADFDFEEFRWLGSLLSQFLGAFLQIFFLDWALLLDKLMSLHRRSPDS